MTIRPLEKTPLTEIVSCFYEAFDDYIVKMPNDPDFWKERWRLARIRYDLSFGAFENDQMVGFIMIGVDDDAGHLTAFNTGTGVIPAFRGNQIVDKLYAKAIPEFKKAGITRCTLEVIKGNDRAIRVYERIGMKIIKNYPCWKGELDLPKGDFELKKLPLKTIFELENPNEKYYPWDFCNSALQLAEEGVYEFYKVFFESSEIGFFIIKPKDGTLAKVELLVAASTENWQLLFAAIQSISKNVRMNNVDDRRVNLIEGLKIVGLENHLSQFEMEMMI